MSSSIGSGSRQPAEISIYCDSDCLESLTSNYQNDYLGYNIGNDDDKRMGTARLPLQEIDIDPKTDSPADSEGDLALHHSTESSYKILGCPVGSDIGTILEAFRIQSDSLEKRIKSQRRSLDYWRANQARAENLFYSQMIQHPDDKENIQPPVRPADLDVDYDKELEKLKEAKDLLLRYENREYYYELMDED